MRSNWKPGRCHCEKIGGEWCDHGLSFSFVWGRYQLIGYVGREGINQWLVGEVGVSQVGPPKQVALDPSTHPVKQHHHRRCLEMVNESRRISQNRYMRYGCCLWFLSPKTDKESPGAKCWRSCAIPFRGSLPFHGKKTWFKGSEGLRFEGDILVLES